MITLPAVAGRLAVVGRQRGGACAGDPGKGHGVGGNVHVEIDEAVQQNGKHTATAGNLEETAAFVRLAGKASKGLADDSEYDGKQDDESDDAEVRQEVEVIVVSELDFILLAGGLKLHKVGLKPTHAGAKKGKFGNERERVAPEVRPQFRHLVVFGDEQGKAFEQLLRREGHHDEQESQQQANYGNGAPGA